LSVIDPPSRSEYAPEGGDDDDRNGRGDAEEEGRREGDEVEQSENGPNEEPERIHR
jgi:hypothetical protein